MKVTILKVAVAAALLVLVSMHETLAQGRRNVQSYVPTPGSTETPQAYIQPKRSGRSAKIVRIILAAATIACEFTNCQGSESVYEQDNQSEYPVLDGNLPLRAGESNEYDVSRTPSRAVNYFDSSGSSPSPAVRRINSATRPNYSVAFPQDQLSQGLRARVEWVRNRIRQLRGFVRGIRFRRVGPWRWECEVEFSIPSNPVVAKCRIKTDGTIEGLP